MFTHKAHSRYISSLINSMVKNSTQNNGNKVNGIRVLSEMKTINMYISQTSQIQHKSLPIGEHCWGAENANINYSCIYQKACSIQPQNNILPSMSKSS